MLVPSTPKDADTRRQARPVLVYDATTLSQPPMAEYVEALSSATTRKTITVPPRCGRVLRVNAGEFFRIQCVDGSQVGDMNLWDPNDLEERFYSGKTRALHGTHVTIGDRLWSTLPYLRPMATIIEDSLTWYGVDDDGGRVHDVIGTRCDPYTHHMLKGKDYNHCCHSNLTRALADYTSLSLAEVERHVHDVLNVFMCTGFTKDSGKYFMKESPARAGDFITFHAEIDLLVGLSACPGGNCGDQHSSDVAVCHSLQIDVLARDQSLLNWLPAVKNEYAGAHLVEHQSGNQSSL